MKEITKIKITRDGATTESKIKERRTEKGKKKEIK